jgi:GTP-binding protein Era
MVKTTHDTIGGVDGVVLVVEAREAVGDIEADLIRGIRNQGVGAILVINKIDSVRPENIAKTIAAYAKEFDFDSVIPVSAKNGKGVDIVVDECKRYLYESDWFFSDEIVTDQPERQMVAEIIREKLLRNLDEEIPHGTAVVIEGWEESRGKVSIRAEIYCEKATHKGIIIGKNGATIKRIGTHAREDVEKLLDTKVFLELYVRVKENWRESLFNVANLGYTED